jgi:hypothetical protein
MLHLIAGVLFQDFFAGLAFRSSELWAYMSTWMISLVGTMQTTLFGIGASFVHVVSSIPSTLGINLVSF